MSEVIKFRRELHMIPEESLKEYKTKKYIISQINDLDCIVHEIGDTGLALYFDKKQSTTIALRCDMDALEIFENNNVDYKSQHTGFSHACGHDGHMAILLAFARYINDKTSKNNLLLIFQPAEENIEGAELVINSKILDKYNVKHVFGMHIWPDLDNNVIYTKKRELCAMTSMLNIEINGKSVHVANSEDGVDALEITSYFLSDLYKYEKSIDKSIFRLLKFGKLNSGTSWNIISDKSVISGTLRTYSKEIFDGIVYKINEIKKYYEKEFDCVINIVYSKPCLTVDNDENLAQRFLDMGIKEVTTPYLQGEDFGAYTQKLPSCFFLLGCGYDTKLHTNNFNFDETILETGVNLYKAIANMEF